MGSFDMELEDTDELIHYGVLGMKWGVRRSQRQLDRLAGRARRAESETKTVKKLATAYTNSMDKRAAKKPSSVTRANEAKTAHKIADTYVNAMNKKATKARTMATTLDKKINPVKYMSDAELRTRLNRLQMERQYSQLSGINVSKGKEYAQNIIKAGTTVAAVTGTVLTIYGNVGKIKNIIEKKG